MRSSIVSQLFFPPKCVGCRERLDIFCGEFDEKSVFCPDCLSKWEKEKTTPCSTCRVAAVECTCRPDILDKKYVDCISLIKFGRTDSADLLIYSLKKRKLTRAFEFASSELAKRFSDYARDSDIDPSGAIFTSVPRKRSTVARIGFDHAGLLAKMTASKVDYRYEVLLRRVKNARDQKKLTGDERIRNAKGSFESAIDGEIEEKTVVLVDDVVTTGSTALECIRVLRASGVKRIVLLSISHAAEKKKSKRKRLKGRKNVKKD